MGSNSKLSAIMGVRLLIYAGFAAMAVAFTAIFWLPYILHGQLLPFGWDTPFYIWKERVLFTEDVATAIALQSPRVGYSLYLGLVHAAGFTDVLLAQKVAATYLAFLLLSANGLLCYLLFKRKVLAFFLAFLVSIGTYGFWRLTEDLYDNVLALVSALTIVCLLLLKFNSKRQQAALVLLIVMVMAVTHLETLAVLLLGGFIYFLTNLKQYSPRQITVVFMAMVVSPGIVALIWLPELGSFLATYRPSIDISASLERLRAVNLSSIPPRTVGSVSGFILFCLYVPIVLYLSIRGSRTHKILFGWLTAVIIVIGINMVLYSFTIPMDRLVLFLPFIPVSVGLLVLLYAKIPQKWLGTAIIFLVLAPGYAQPLEYQSTRTSFLSIDSQEAMMYLSRHNIDTIVPAHTEAENPKAYYGYWQNWLWATGPYDNIGKVQIYNGNLADYKLAKPKFFTTGDTSKNKGFNIRKALLFKEFSIQDYAAFDANSVQLSEDAYITDIGLDNYEDIITSNHTNPWIIQTGKDQRPAYLKHGSLADSLAITLKGTMPQHITLAEVSLIDDKDNFAYFPIARNDIEDNWKTLVFPIPDDSKADLSRVVRVKIDVHIKRGAASDLRIASLAAWHYTADASLISDVDITPDAKGYSMTVPPEANRINIKYMGSQRPNAYLEIKEIGQGNVLAYAPINAQSPGMQFIDVPVRPGAKVRVSGIGFEPMLEIRAYKDGSPAQND